MPLQLLPASAQAFAPRAAPTIVLDRKPESWMTQTLKRINRVKRPLNSVMQHYRCLLETLGAEEAIWTLASLMLPKAPESELRKDDNPLVEALHNYQFIHLEAYVVHVDMVSQQEVAFKLTPETIEALVDYHKDIWSIDASANTYSWPEKNAQLKKMQEEFVQAANRFVFRTEVRALEGLEEGGCGEFLEGRALKVKEQIMNMFVPLLPPPPRIVDVIHPAPIYSNQTMIGGGWWTPNMNLAAAHPPPVESWNVLPSTPSPTDSTCGSDHNSSSYWYESSQSRAQLPSPTPSFSQPLAFTSAPAQFYSSPETITSMPVLQSGFPQHCGSDMTFGYGDLGWPSMNMFGMQYAAPV